MPDKGIAEKMRYQRSIRSPQPTYAAASTASIATIGNRSDQPAAESNCHSAHDVIIVE
jgi:hypothetical protein